MADYHSINGLNSVAFFPHYEDLPVLMFYKTDLKSRLR